MTEVYKDIKGYNGLYQVSNLGNVKRINKKNVSYLKPSNNGKGYLQITLCVNGKRKLFMHHRLIAEAFIGNPNNYQQVNHINGIKTDNSIQNLEWVTAKQNTNHAFKTGLRTMEQFQEIAKKNHKILINQETGVFYESVKEASISLNYSITYLCNMLNNRQRNKTNLIYT
jgi:hypothetical protein